MSINAKFITDQKTDLGSHDIGNLSDKHSQMLAAASLLQSMGKTICVTGTKLSDTSSFIEMQLNSTADSLPKLLLNMRSISKLPTAENSNTVFIATDDQRIGKDELIFIARAAKPTKAFLDDDNMLFFRIFYDLVRYYSTGKKGKLQDADKNSIEACIIKSLEHYSSYSAPGTDALAMRVSPNDTLLTGSLTDILLEALENRLFVAAIQILHKNAENQRNILKTNTENAFVSFCKGCRRDKDIESITNKMWVATVHAITQQLYSYKQLSTEFDGCLFAEDENSITLTVLFTENDNANSPDSKLSRFMQTVFYNGRKTGSEGDFSSIRYIYRINDDILNKLSDSIDSDFFSVIVNKGKHVHALRFVLSEATSYFEKSNVLDEAIKQHACIGLVVLNSIGIPESNVNSAPAITEVLSSANYDLPVFLLEVQRESSFGGKAQAYYAAQLTKRYQKKYSPDSLVHPMTIHLGKNRNKNRPSLCGTLYCSNSSNSADTSAEVPQLPDAEIISRAVASIVHAADKMPSAAIPISSAAFDSDFTQFTADSVTVTTNAFSLLCSCFYESSELSAQSEGFLVNSWLNNGEKFDTSSVFTKETIPETTFINSLRNLHRAALKKDLILSRDVVDSVCNDSERLIPLLEDAIQCELGVFLAKLIGRSCYTAVNNEMPLANASQRFSEALKWISRELLPDDETTISQFNLFGKIMTDAFNRCIYSAISKYCTITE